MATKADVIEAVAAGADLSKVDAGKALDALEAYVTKTIKSGDKVQLTGFVSFETGKRAARTGRNPQTGATLQIPASTVVKVKAGAKLKNAVK